LCAANVPSNPLAITLPTGAATAMTERLSPHAFNHPAILLAGTVDQDMYKSFRTQLDAAPAGGLIVVELSTLGGDPEVARMMGEDVRFHHDLEPERRFVFLGKSAVYSAGATFMSFFVRENRYLTRGTRLLIHERRLEKNLRLSGPLSACFGPVEAVLSEIRASMEIQREGFASLAKSSSVSPNELERRAASDWYVEAQEACSLGLVEAVI